MPERTITDLTQAALKFAAGDDRTREQLSSTWYVRMTRGAEIYVFNKHAGGNRAHISFHKDGRCHLRIEDSGGVKVTHVVWELPEPIDDEGLLRLATVVIPHRGLVLPVGFVSPEDDAVLIPPPPKDHQLEIDILCEPGSVPFDAWPAPTGLDAKLVGRFTLHSESRDKGLLNFTLVSTVRPEGQTARALSEASVALPDGAGASGTLGAVFFELVEVDDRQLPVLTEMPVGHMTQLQSRRWSPKDRPPRTGWKVTSSPKGALHNRGCSGGGRVGRWVGVEVFR